MSIGRDVAITPQGPVIAEANSHWFSLTRRGFWRDRDDVARRRAAL